MATPSSCAPAAGATGLPASALASAAERSARPFKVGPPARRPLSYLPAAAARHLTNQPQRHRPSRSAEETMSQQLGAGGNDRDQHQLLEGLRCNFIAHMLPDV